MQRRINLSKSNSNIRGYYRPLSTERGNDINCNRKIIATIEGAVVALIANYLPPTSPEETQNTGIFPIRGLFIPHSIALLQIVPPHRPR
jgi:hypothetical protein